jgi:hypothetical protein
MANVIILDPARFNSDLVGGTRRYIRTAFFDQGYGVSERFSGYARGAGIVPNTAPFSTIGLGTVGSPLRMSQFSGLTIPPLALDTQTFTVADYDTVTYYDDPIGDFQYDISHRDVFGTMSPGTSSVYTGANVSVIAWTWSYGVYPSPQTLAYYVVRPNAFGAIPNSGWTTLTINDSVQGISTYARTSMTFSSFSSGGNQFGAWSIETADPFYPPDTFQPGTTHSATASLS